MIELTGFRTKKKAIHVAGIAVHTSLSKPNLSLRFILHVDFHCILHDGRFCSQSAAYSFGTFFRPPTVGMLDVYRAGDNKVQPLSYSLPNSQHLVDAMRGPRGLMLPGFEDHVH